MRRFILPAVLASAMCAPLFAQVEGEDGYVGPADDKYKVMESSKLFIPAPGVLANDTLHDPAANGALLMQDAANGHLRLNDDGSFSYRPLDGFVGEDTFAYCLADGSGLAKVTITVLQKPVDDGTQDADQPEGEVEGQETDAEGDVEVPGEVEGEVEGGQDDGTMPAKFELVFAADKLEVEAVAGAQYDVQMMDGLDIAPGMMIVILDNGNPDMFAQGPALDAQTGMLSFALATEYQAEAAITLALVDANGELISDVYTLMIVALGADYGEIVDPTTEPVDGEVVIEGEILSAEFVGAASAPAHDEAGCTSGAGALPWQAAIVLLSLLAMVRWHRREAA